MQRNYKKFLAGFILLVGIISGPLINNLSVFAINGEGNTKNKVESNDPIPVNEQKLVFDNDNHNKIPERFRKTTDTIATPGNLNLTGLKDTNISGSQQYSKEGFCLLKCQLPKNMNLVFVDLRQESHGFINGLPISWEGNGDKANMGLSRDEVLKRNVEQLASIKIGSPLNISEKSITPEKVFNEEELILSNKNTYLRVTVTDTKLPTDDMVNFFVKNITKVPKNSWLHFHCKEGIGRTTVFMTMYDMMKNAKNVPMNDIVLRQIKLANLEGKEEGLENKDRMAFYVKFYDYAKEGNFNKDFKS